MIATMKLNSGFPLFYRSLLLGLVVVSSSSAVEQHQVDVEATWLHRQGAFQKELTREEILAIPNQEILPAWKVLMKTGSVPPKVRIIWYRVDPSGDFTRE